MNETPCRSWFSTAAWAVRAGGRHIERDERGERAGQRGLDGAKAALFHDLGALTALSAA
jgi:hypothetical protein